MSFPYISCKLLSESCYHDIYIARYVTMLKFQTHQIYLIYINGLKNKPVQSLCSESRFNNDCWIGNEIFNLTQDGMKFFEGLFGFPYPFGKYDQIFCPEYSSGAMENAGAVTLNDEYIFKEEVPLSTRDSRQNTILHELSHMWFGDLVTMRWWDDLWLNESFAEFISHLCQSHIKHLPEVDVWVSF